MTIKIDNRAQMSLNCLECAVIFGHLPVDGLVGPGDYIEL